VTLLKCTDAESEIALVFNQSRNRQVRRLFRALRHEVRSLCRVRIGGVALDDLPPGQLRTLSPREVGSILAARRPGRGRRA
jgi:16S rRNA U516 pseudouridylate synthase RsuA-like enzyme